MFDMLGHIGMLIPGGVVGVVRVVDLYITDASLAEPAGSKTVLSEIVGVFFTDTIHFESGGAFLRKIKDVGSIILHPPG